ncbi:MAG: hypothetical protein GY938_20550, partial [Ketobacter sp.]|nr:hypothetical protein [Ketobacter sp.]
QRKLNNRKHFQLQKQEKILGKRAETLAKREEKYTEQRKGLTEDEHKFDARVQKTLESIRAREWKLDRAEERKRLAEEQKQEQKQEQRQTPTGLDAAIEAEFEEESKDNLECEEETKAETKTEDSAPQSTKPKLSEIFKAFQKEKHESKRKRSGRAHSHEVKDKKLDEHEAEEKAYEPFTEGTGVEKPLNEAKSKVGAAPDAELNFKLIYEIMLLNANYGQVNSPPGCVSTDEWKLPSRANINDELAQCSAAMPGMGIRDFKPHELINNKPRKSAFYQDRLSEQEQKRLRRGGRAKFFAENLKLLNPRVDSFGNGRPSNNIRCRRAIDARTTYTWLLADVRKMLDQYVDVTQILLMDIDELILYPCEYNKLYKMVYDIAWRKLLSQKPTPESSSDESTQSNSSASSEESSSNNKKISKSRRRKNRARRQQKKANAKSHKSRSNASTTRAEQKKANAKPHKSRSNASTTEVEQKEANAKSQNPRSNASTTKAEPQSRQK